jgi:hypothetical protein
MIKVCPHCGSDESVNRRETVIKTKEEDGADIVSYKVKKHCLVCDKTLPFISLAEWWTKCVPIEFYPAEA